MLARTTLFALMLSAALPAAAGTITQTNLTTDGATPAAHTDANLKNPWGISYSPSGAFWVSDNATGLTTLYDGTGSIVPLVVSIPSATGKGTGSPTGQVFNATTDFKVGPPKSAAPAAFLFATEDGTISGWNPSVSANAVLAVNHASFNAVFKGLALYSANSKNYLLATDFRLGLVEIFDGKFQLIAAFRDPALPPAFSPYNVAVLGGGIYVTYAKVNPLRHDSVSGPGLGVVEKVTFAGVVQARAVGGLLNAPWGLAIAPASWGPLAGNVLVGNFGSGTIAAFTPTLHANGELMDKNGKPIAIDGLWGLIPGNGGQAGSASDIYFAGGTNGEADGLFGSLSYTP